MGEVCIVGHTGVGKTSLVRTLVRDPSAGVVTHEANATRCICRFPVMGTEKRVTLADTPGFESIHKLVTEIDCWAREELTERSRDEYTNAVTAIGPTYRRGIACSRWLQAGNGAAPCGCNVLNSVKQACAVVFVLDARIGFDPSLEVLVEFDLIGSIAHISNLPLAVVVNGGGTAAGRRHVRGWVEAIKGRAGILKESGDYAFRVFCLDAFRLDRATEAALVGFLESALRGGAQQGASSWLKSLEEARTERNNVVALELARVVLDLASYRMFVKKKGAPQDAEAAASGLSVAVNKRILKCLAAIVNKYRFLHDDSSAPGGPGNSEQVAAANADLTLCAKVGGGVAGGAAAGAAVSGLLLGMDLGISVVIGGALGAAGGGSQHYWRTLVRGEVAQRVEEESVVELFDNCLRFVFFVSSLGYADTNILSGRVLLDAMNDSSLEPEDINALEMARRLDNAKGDGPKYLSEIVREAVTTARKYPSWCPDLAEPPRGETGPAKRYKAEADLSEQILAALERSGAF